MSTKIMSTEKVLAEKSHAEIPHVRTHGSTRWSAVSATPNRGIMLSMALALASVAFVTDVSASTSETLGLWVLNGEPGTPCADGTELRNLVDGSPLSLVASITNTSGNVVQSPTYVADVPGDWLFTDWTLTNKVCNLTSSLLLSTGSVYSVGSYLRINGLASAVADSDFTIELLVKPNFRVTSGFGRDDTFFMGFNGPSLVRSPQVVVGEYNGGILSVLTNETSKASIQVQPYVWFYDTPLFDNEWHHIMLTYSKSNKKVTLYLNNMSKTKAVSYGDSGLDLWMEEGTYFQVLGIVGRLASSFSSARVAAIRVSSGLRERIECLHVTRDFDANPLLGRWRFTGQEGTLVTQVTNEVAPLPINSYNCFQDASKTSDTYGFYYTAAPHMFVADTESSEDYVSNPTVAMTSEAKKSALGNLQNKMSGFKIANFHEAMMPTSFTAECFCLMETNLTASLGSGGRTALMGETAEQNLGTDIRWLVRQVEPDMLDLQVRDAGLNTGKTVATLTTSAFGLRTWRHVAVVYDTSSEKPTVKFYVDYKQVGNTYTFSDSSGLMFSPASGKLVLAGASARGCGGGWWGGFDEFRFTRGALSPSEFMRMRNPKGTCIFFR